MRDEEEPVGELPGNTHGSCDYAMKCKRGNKATEDDWVEYALQPDTSVDEESVVEDQVEEYETIDDAAQDSVVAVDVLVGRLEYPRERVQGF